MESVPQYVENRSLSLRGWWTFRAYALKFIFLFSHFFLLFNDFKVRVATITHDHDDTPHTIFNTISGTCWKVNEFIDFNLKNRTSNLSACFSALICDFSQFIKIPLSKTMKTGF